MASKLINTRIKNKVDSYSSWKNSTGVLLNGEIALVRVPTGESYVNPVTGKSEPVIELLMKVGDGESTFNSLPWLSAKASDVYNWAKGEKAEDVKINIKIGTDNTDTESTLGTWLKSVYDKSFLENASKISANTGAIETLNKPADQAGSVANSIKVAIEALNSTESGSGNFVTAVTQDDGIVTVTKGNIAESDLPNISASKIIITPASGTPGSEDYVAAETLPDKISSFTSRIVALEQRDSGLDTEIGNAINDALNDLDYNDPSTDGSTATEFIASVSQENGKISAVKKNLPTASDSIAGIVQLDIAGGAASYNSVYGTDGLASKVSQNESEISNLKIAVTGGVHFIGITSDSNMDDDYTIGTIPIDVVVDGITSTKSHVAAAGDVVIKGDKEFIWTGTAWKELGDLTRVGTLETWREKLVKDDTKVEHEFITEVDIAADGTVTISRAQPTSEDISHSGSTVNATLVAYGTELNKLADIKDTTVGAAITSAIEALDVEDSGTGFVTAVTQTDGKISVTKNPLPTASTSAAGIVQLNNNIDSTSVDEAATANAVKTAYDKAEGAHERAAAIEGDYVKFKDNQLFVGKDGAEEIIFDCGGAINEPAVEEPTI